MKGRLGLGMRRADDWSSPHERARTRAAQRLDWELDPDENAWLEAHLAECDRCRAVAAEHDAIHDRLRTLRGQTPPPPRDLWARTAAAIEQEAQAHGRRPSRSRHLPLGVLSGALVILVVVGASMLANLPLQRVAPPESTASALAIRPTPAASDVPSGTPFAVAAGDVQYLSREGNGSFGFRIATVDEVCPDDQDAGCPVIEDARATAVALEADPESVIGSPDDGQAVIVASDADGGANVYVMPLPTEPGATPVVPTTPSAGPPSEPPATEAPSVPPASAEPPSEPPASSEPPATSQPFVTAEPSESAPPTPSEVPSEPPASAAPSGSPVGMVTEEPSLAPEAITIARGLIVSSEHAAYSADGRWFGFTARPADGSHGPDIYVWRVGDPEAVPVTTDHRSVFGSWIGDRIVGSRPVPDDGTAPSASPAASPTAAASPELEVETFALDPVTGEETALAGGGWRPILAPSGDFAIVWTGTVTATDGEARPATGRLELQRWDGSNGPVEPTDATLVGDDPAPFDARWDESGDALAIWVEDPADPGIGRLSLYFVDPVTGMLEQPEHAPRNVPALPGFSIGQGRLAWATPRGQGGEGSRVLIVAWTDDGVGRVESAPGDEVLVIR